MLRIQRTRKQKHVTKGEQAEEMQQAVIGHKTVGPGNGRMAGVKGDVDMKHCRGNWWQMDFQKN